MSSTSNNDNIPPPSSSSSFSFSPDSYTLNSSTLPRATSPPSSSHQHSTENTTTTPRKRDTRTSLLGHITYPISYTTNAVLRRLSEDSAPTPLARALSANYNGSMYEATPHTLFNPPNRRHSPFQPPPLTPLTLSGYHASTASNARLLSPALAEEIRLLLPPRLQLVDTWALPYSLAQNGASLKSLYTTLSAFSGKRAGFVIVVRDSRGGVFGAYVSDPPSPCAHFFGTGESFLWRAVKVDAGTLDEEEMLANLPPPPSEDTENMVMGRSTTIGIPAYLSSSNTSSSASLSSLGGSEAVRKRNGNGHGNGRKGQPTDRVRFKAFPYTGENDFVMFCQSHFLSVGGGDGRYGLWIDDGLAKGISSPCPTFMNEALSEEGEKFGILGVEVWYIGA